MLNTCTLCESRLPAYSKKDYIVKAVKLFLILKNDFILELRKLCLARDFSSVVYFYEMFNL